MKNEFIIEKIYKMSSDNHFFFSKEMDFEKAFLKHNQDAKRVNGFDFPLIHIRTVDLHGCKETSDFIDAVKKAFFTPIEKVDDNTTIIKISQMLSEKSIKTNYIYLKNSSSLLKFNSKKTIKYLKTIVALSGVRLIVFGDEQLYSFFTKNQNYFTSQFIVHNIDGSEHKKYVPFLCEDRVQNNMVLLGGADAVVKSNKNRSFSGKVINVVPYATAYGDYASIDKKKGISFWKIKELEFCKRFSKEELIDVINREIIENEHASIQSVFVVCSDSARYEFHSGFENDGVCYCVEHHSKNFSSSAIHDVNSFVKNKMESIFSISILSGDTDSNYQDKSSDLSPLVSIPTPEKDILYSFLTMYYVDGLNVIYIEKESVTKHSLELDNMSPNELAERILSDVGYLSGSTIVFEDNCFIKKDSIDGFTYSKKIEKLYTITPAKKFEEYIQKHKNLVFSMEEGEYVLNSDIFNSMDDFSSFNAVEASFSDSAIEEINGRQLVPFSFVVLKDEVLTSNLEKVFSSMSVKSVKEDAPSKS